MKYMFMRVNCVKEYKETDDRAVRLGEYIARSGATVRAAARVYGVSKSTVHTDVTLWSGLFG